MTATTAATGAPGAERVRVTGFLPPIASPMRDGRLDLPSFRRQLDYLVDHVAGYLVGGSVGEAASLTLEERETLMRTCAEHAGGSRRLAVSISDNCIESSRRLSATAGDVRADLVMVSCPNYYSNDRAMLVDYFGALAEFAPTDICVYDNPLASNTTLSVEDIVAIAEAVPRVTHIKVTDTSLDKVAVLREQTDLVVHAGDDAVLWHQLDRGAEGAMVALPMIYPDCASGLWNALSAGDRDAAYAEYQRATAFFHLALGGVDYVAVIKTVLHARGVIDSPELRLPLRPASEHRRAEILAAL